MAALSATRVLAVPALVAMALVLASLAAAQTGGERPYTSSLRLLAVTEKTQLADRFWRPGCPVALSELRVLTVTQWGFDGKARNGKLIVNRDVANPLRTVFERLYELRFPIRYLQIDIYGPAAALPAHGDFSGSFECRKAVPSPCGTGSGNWSNHAYGHAIDLNPRENPYVGCGRVRDPTRERYINRTRLYKGMVTPAVVRAFASIGWGWGGSWAGQTKDYMHFSTTGG